MITSCTNAQLPLPPPFSYRQRFVSHRVADRER
jgi:rRNA maturation protein Nop10